MIALPQGPKGDTGDTGPQGPKGDTGESGVYYGSVDDALDTAMVVVDPNGDADSEIDELREEVNLLSEEIADEVAAREQAINDLKAQGVQQVPLFANSIEECTDTSKMYVLPDGYIYAYMYSEGQAASYTNWLLLADTSILLSGDASVTASNGYFSGVRLNSSGLLKECSGYSATGFIPYQYSGVSDYIAIKNLTAAANTT